MRCDVALTSRIRSVSKALSSHYDDWRHYNRNNPLEELLFIICSIQTNEDLYRATFARLRRAFPSFEDLANAEEWQIANHLALGGLAKQKAKAIKGILKSLVATFGRPTLSPLRTWPEHEQERFLLSLPGVGKKTARCVAMYSFGAEVFPVDTHCWRIARRLGWVRATRPDKSCSPKDMDRLQRKIPHELRCSLHVNLVSLGREYCTTAGPQCDSCPIRSYCRRGEKGITSKVKLTSGRTIATEILERHY